MKEEEQRFGVAVVVLPEPEQYEDHVALTPEQAVEAFIENISGVPEDGWALFSVMDQYGSHSTYNAFREDGKLQVSLCADADSPMRTFMVSEWVDRTGEGEWLLDARSLDEAARQGGERLCRAPRPLALRVIPEGGLHTLHYKIQLDDMGRTDILAVITEEAADTELKANGVLA